MRPRLRLATADMPAGSYRQPKSLDASVGVTGAYAGLYFFGTTTVRYGEDGVASGPASGGTALRTGAMPLR